VIVALAAKRLYNAHRAVGQQRGDHEEANPSATRPTPPLGSVPMANVTSTSADIDKKNAK